jgi:hypothetical protein
LEVAFCPVLNSLPGPGVIPHAVAVTQKAKNKIDRKILWIIELTPSRV